MPLNIPILTPIVGARKSLIGIDLDGRTIKAVQLARITGKKKAWRVDSVAALERLNPNEAIDQDEIARLVDVLDRQGFTGRSTVVCMPSQKVMTSVLDVPPPQSGAPRSEIARMELATIHRCEPNSFEMASWDLPTSARPGEGSQVMAVACTHENANSILDRVENAGLTVQALDVRALAVTRACQSLLLKDSVAGLISLDWNAALVVMLHRGLVVYERLIPDAGLHALYGTLTDQLSEQEQMIDYVLHEHGLIQKTSAGGDVGADYGLAADVSGIIKAHFDALIEQTRMSCTYVAHQYHNSVPQQLMLTGDGAAIPGLARRFEEFLEIEVRVILPVDLVECPPALAKRCQDPGLTIAVGLAQYTE